jgi:hypothetical protein
MKFILVYIIANVLIASNSPKQREFETSDELYDFLEQHPNYELVDVKEMSLT